MRVLLLGNPNCGKTTLFNRLTGCRARAGNRLGLTVEVLSANMQGGGAEILDLPGLYRLDGGGADEQTAAEAVRSSGCDMLLNVVDATRLSGSLYLTTQLTRLGIPMAVAVNMADEAAAQGVVLDPDALSALLGVPVVLCSAATGQGLAAVRSAVLRGGAVPRFRCRDTDDERRRAIERLLAAAVRKIGRPGRYAPDSVLLHPFWGVFAFLTLMAGVFFLTFGAPGAFLSDALDALFRGRLYPVIKAATATLPPFVAGLLSDGLWAGACSVLAFLPQITLLTAGLTLMEDAGILSRAAFLFDGLLRKLGLSGGAVVPLLLGFGCGVPAALACRTVPDPRERERAMWLLPFFPCAAKLPVFLLVCRLTFPTHTGAAVFLIYLASILLGVLAALPRRRQRDAGQVFVLELPPYRAPALRNVLPAVGARVTHFLLRAGTAITALSAVLYALSHLSAGWAFTLDGTGSLLTALCARLTPMTGYLGVATPELVAALLAGAFAKEAAAAALTVLPSAGAMTAGTAACFLILFAAGPPCAAALAVMEQESPSRTRFLMRLFLRCGYAAVLAAVVNLLFRLF